MRKNLFSKGMMIFTALMFVVAFSGFAVADDTPNNTQGVQQQPQQPTKMTMKETTGNKTTATKGILDGRTFTGQIGKTGATTGDKEVITFKNGMFHSLACDPMGFTPAAYTATKESGGLVKFSATCTSPTNGQMQWTGTIKGETLDASVNNIQEGKDPVAMWAKATKAKMESKGTGARKGSHNK